MNAVADRLPPAKLAMVGAAALIGLSLSTMLDGGQVALPALGAVPRLALGGLGLVAGVGLYIGVKRYSASGCGCEGECNC